MRTLTGASVGDVNEAFRAARELLESGAMAVTRKGAQDSLPTRDEIEHLLIQSQG
jgi:sugar/nucleoside kinase (ribokinase family)